ncbi:OmpA family protein [Vibrio rarus]|uniref:OmpA family protein n=1 Tax=Vibrio rarus TaxID=413403 RepID=UPI0021C26BFA|nr:OmpA family protein [Vibrio rarus]
MKLFVAVWGLGISAFSVQAVDLAVNNQIDQLCSTENMVIKHSVSIGQAYAVAGNRAQHYQIQPSLNDEQKSKLKTTPISLETECFEYLNSNNLLQVDSNGVVARVYFNFDQSDLTDTSKLTLTALAQHLKDLNEVPKLDVIGHTDNIGSDEYNKKLAAHRAKTSKVYLVENHITKEILSTHSASFSHPIQDNATEQGRAANRRVEIKISDPS